MTITDLYGRLIFQKNGLMLADVPFDIALEKDAIAAGIYIVSCQNGATYLVQKVVIQ